MSDLSPQRKEKKARGDQTTKTVSWLTPNTPTPHWLPALPRPPLNSLCGSQQALQMDLPVEVFKCLPKDPVLRKQHLEELMMKIHSSFSFMQVVCSFG